MNDNTPMGDNDITVPRAEYERLKECERQLYAKTTDAPTTDDVDDLKQEFCDYCVNQADKQEGHLTYAVWLEDKLMEQRAYSHQIAAERDELKAENGRLLNEKAYTSVENVMALEAECDELRATVEALVSVDDDTFWRAYYNTEGLVFEYKCIYCKALGVLGDSWQHKPDCPVVRGRDTLVGEVADGD